MTPTATPTAPAVDIAQLCRDSLMAYGEYVHGLRAMKHHRAWCRDFRALAESDNMQLLLVAPPGWAKSSWLMCFIEWYLGHHPDHFVVFLTSSDSQATKFNTAIRTMMESPKYQQVFPAEANRPDKDRGWSGEGLWLKSTPPESTNPAFRAAGFGSSIIGSRAHLMVLDDPLTQEAAQSETEQPKAKSYYDSTIVPRLKAAHQRIIMITTRWHGNDLAAHVLTHEGWTLRLLPALDENDESTWPEEFPTVLVKSFRKRMGTAQFSTVYQGSPTDYGGEFYQDEKWFRPLPPDFDKRNGYTRVTKRESLITVQFWDLAYSDNPGANYSACVTAGQDEDMNFYVLGAWRTKRDESDLVDAIVRQWKLYRPRAIGLERGMWDKSKAVKEIVRQVRKQIPVAIWTVDAKLSKQARAMLPADRAKNGMFFLDDTAPWAHDYKAELLGFDKAEYDDWVDATSGAAELFASKMAFLYDIKKMPRQFFVLGSVKTSADVGGRPAAIKQDTWG